VPFTGLTYPGGIAAADNGDIYLTDSERVLKLAAGSSEQTVLPFTGVKTIGDVAVDGSGNVYATDTTANQVLKLAASSNVPTALPFSGLDGPQHIAVDRDGRGECEEGDHEESRDRCADDQGDGRADGHEDERHHGARQSDRHQQPQAGGQSLAVVDPRVRSDVLH
jgi:DNA-binding beta-propeller fold protein YncE